MFPQFSRGRYTPGHVDYRLKYLPFSPEITAPFVQGSSLTMLAPVSKLVPHKHTSCKENGRTGCDDEGMVTSLALTKEGDRLASGAKCGLVEVHKLDFPQPQPPETEEEFFAMSDIAPEDEAMSEGENKVEDEIIRVLRDTYTSMPYQEEQN